MRQFENTPDAVKRAASVAMWLRSDSLYEEVGAEGAVVLVSHADFIALLLAALHGDASGVGAAAAAGRSPDNDVSYHSCTERQLDVSGAAAAAARQEEYARSVYTRYKTSLACTCLLDIDRSGAVEAVWMNEKRHLKDKGKCSVQ